MNLAGIWKLGVIFVCENNRYAESTPFEYSVAGGSVARRAAGYGFPGVCADGQSAIEMHEVAGEAVRRARAGEGPTLIEAQTYRYLGHFGADDPRLYRSEAEEAHYRARDCIAGLRAHLLQRGVAREAELAAREERALATVAEAVRFAEESAFPAPEELFTDVCHDFDPGHFTLRNPDR